MVRESFSSTKVVMPKHATESSITTFLPSAARDLVTDELRKREASLRALEDAEASAATIKPEVRYGEGEDSAPTRRQEYLQSIAERYEGEAARAAEYQAVRSPRPAAPLLPLPLLPPSLFVCGRRR
jgi:hypothetical protein